MGEGQACQQTLFPQRVTPSKHGPSPTSHFYRNPLKLCHDLNVKCETVNLPEGNVHDLGSGRVIDMGSEASGKN